MVERAVVVEQSEEEGPDDAAVLVPAEPGYDAVRRPLVLDLDHRPLALAVGVVEALGDDAVEARALEALEPLSGKLSISGRRGEVDRRTDRSQRPLEHLAALAQRCRPQVLVVEGEEVEGHERRWRLRREAPHARLGGMDALLQGVEVEPVGAGDHDLPVHDAARGK